MGMFRNNQWRSVCVVSVGTALAPGAGLPTAARAESALYVDDDAPRGGDGLSWATAHAFLADALAVASDPANGVSEIRIAQGRYTPDRSAANPDGTWDRESSFQLAANVALAGGYLGLSAKGGEDPNQRNIDSHKTILSGDLAGDDLPPTEPGEFPNSQENAYQVITVIGLHGSAFVDGFIVSGGRADGIDNGDNPASRDRGSAVNVFSDSLTLTNCTFSQNWSGRGGVNDCGKATSFINCTFQDNFANYAAGGLYIHASSAPVLSNCAFIDNVSLGEGGGVYCAGLSEAVFTGCTFTGNSAIRGGGILNQHNSPSFNTCSFQGNLASQGAGMFNDQSKLSLTQCAYSGNSAYSGGGAIWNDGGSPAIVHCSFTENYADGGGGGIWNVDSSPTILNCTFTANSGYGPGSGLYNAGGSPVVTDCTFSSNIAFAGGGGMWNGASTPTITNCTFDNNFALSGGGLYNGEHSDGIVINCLFTANQAGEGGGMYNLQSDVTATGCTFTANIASGGAFPVGGGMNNYYCNPRITDCLFQSNIAELGGGGMYNEGEGPIVTNCRFHHNASFGEDHGWGGGMFNGYFCTPTVTNCAFVGNGARKGGGIFNFVFSGPAISNCTLSGNAAFTPGAGSGEGGGIYSFTGSEPVFANVIAWSNTPDQINGIPINLTYSCIQGGYTGAQNIDADPLFVRDPEPGPDEMWGTADDDLGDLHLMPGSPCLDAGDNTAVPIEVEFDLDGNPRFGDDPATADSGNSGPGSPMAIVDFGPYEFQPALCEPDIAPPDGDGLINVDDLLAVINQWGPCPVGNCTADIVPPGAPDGLVNVDDLLAIINAWGPCR